MSLANGTLKGGLGLIDTGFVAEHKLTKADVIADLSPESLINSATALEQLGKDFVLFYTGLLCRVPGLKDDPVQMYMAHAPGEPAVGVIRTERTPMFDAPGDWGKVVWFCARPDWDGLKNFLEQFSVILPNPAGNDRAFTTFWHQVEINDARALESGKWDAKDRVPRVAVQVLGLSGTKHQFFHTSAAADSPMRVAPARGRYLSVAEAAPAIRLAEHKVDETWAPLDTPPPPAAVVPEVDEPWTEQELTEAWRAEFGEQYYS